MNIIAKTPAVKNKFIFLCQQARIKAEQLACKQFYEKNGFFLNLSSYVDFFSKDLYNLFSYIKVSEEALKNNINKLKALHKFLPIFKLQLLTPKKKTLLQAYQDKLTFLKFCFITIRKILSFFSAAKKVSIKVKESIFTNKEISEIFSYLSSKSIFFYKNAIFIPESPTLFFIKASKNFLAKNNQKIQFFRNNYLLAKIIYQHEIIVRSFYKFIYYCYLLKKELTFSEFFSLKKKKFFNDALTIFRKQVIKKTFKLNLSLQAKTQFLRTFVALKNIRPYFFA